MRNKFHFWIILTLFVVFPACSQQHYNSEEDFNIKILDGGKSSIEIIKYVGTITDVKIPPRINKLPVTRIGEKAFYGFNEDGSLSGILITNITIPNSVIHIGDFAFAYNQLTNVTIPNSVTYIGYGAFDANQITSVTIPNSVTYIGERAFSTNQLTSVTIPDSVTYIGESAFSVNQLTSVTIPNSVTYIRELAFHSNQLTSVTIPNSVRRIGDYAFAYNQLTSVTIPNSVTFIDASAFANNQLTSVTIPDSVTLIEKGAFAKNQLTSIKIGANVELYYKDNVDYVFDNKFDDFYKTNRSMAGIYNYKDGRWSFSSSDSNQSEQNQAKTSNNSNRIANTTWESFKNIFIGGYNGRMTISFGETSFSSTYMLDQVETRMAGSYSINGDFIKLSAKYATANIEMTGSLIGDTLTISGFFEGEFHRIR